MTEKPPLLIHSNAPWASTGYAVQCALFANLLSDHYRMGVSAFYGLEGARLQYNEDIIVYPGVGQSYGNEIIEAHAQSHFGSLRGGLVMTLMDVWVLNTATWRKLNLCSWAPVDHDPAPPLVERFFRESASIPIAMSRFGQEKLAEFDPLYVPHGVDTKVFAPIEKKEARERSGLPDDRFVVGVVAANKGNPPRKSFVEILLAFKVFWQRHKDAVLYLHTEIQGTVDGVNLPLLIKAVGLPDGSVLYTDQHRYRFWPYPPEMMAAVYSGMDVLLNPARGEGFGIPVLEAQACGTPGIVTDFSAMPEVCGAGWHVEHEPEWTHQLSWQARPKVEDIVSALEHAYRMPSAQREALSVQAVQHAAQYDAGRVLTEHFLPALEEVQDRLDARGPVEVR